GTRPRSGDQRRDNCGDGGRDRRPADGVRGHDFECRTEHRQPHRPRGRDFGAGRLPWLRFVELLGGRTHLRRREAEGGAVWAGQFARATLYFLAPENEGGFTFTAIAHVGEGRNDTPSAAHRDLFTGTAEVTVLEPSADRIAGFSLENFRTFTTGLDNLDEGNP